MPITLLFVNYYLEQILPELLFILKIQKKYFFKKYWTSASTKQKRFLMVIHNYCMQPCIFSLLEEKITADNVPDYLI